jgi:acetyltransferase-like isoleucine patch superfamily enzyme
MRAPSSLHHLPTGLERLGFRDKLALYGKTLSTSPYRLLVEQLVFLLASWVPTVVGVGLRQLLYPLVMRAGFPVLIEKNVTIHRPGALRLGRNVFLAENVYLLAGGEGITIGDYTEVLPNCAIMIRDYRGVVPPPRIDIGCRVGINVGAFVFSHGRTRIGDDALIGAGSVITTAGHAYDDPTRPINEQGVTARAIVLPGCRVGEGAVVGAGAVVSTDVPPHSLAVGIPARVVKTWKPGERDARG